MTRAGTEKPLACPRCRRPIRRARGEGWHCGHCSIRFPTVAGIPCLYVDPAAALAEWRGRLQFELEKLRYDADGIRSELANPRLRPLTRERLTLVNRALIDQSRRLAELLTPLAAQGAGGTLAAHHALKTRLPADQGLTTYYANLHRDWCWGTEENEASCQIVGDALGTVDGTLAVLGAGGGRLAHDLALRGTASRIIALDFNPLLLLVAKRAMRADAVELWEFPIAPRTIEDSARLRRLSAPVPAERPPSLVLGDVLRPPFERGSLHAVLTPWLVDILPEDFPVLAARINEILKPGGRWIVFGSLAFAPPGQAGRYSPEECLAILRETGFGETAVEERGIPYMCSPASRHGRRERVLCVAATKTREVPAPPPARSIPDWLRNGTQPVPALRDFQLQAATTRIHAFLMSLIDGRRSIRDIAKLLEEQRLMTRAEAEPAVRNFLLRMYDDSRRAGGS